MRPHCVEVPALGLDDHASLREGVEDLAIEKFIAQSCIEATIATGLNQAGVESGSMAADQITVYAAFASATASGPAGNRS